MVARVRFAVNGLDTRGIVHMRDGWDGRTRHVELLDAKQSVLGRRHFTPMVLGYVGHEKHIGTVGVEVEPAGHVLTEYGRRKGPEGLAVLHLQVQQGLHGRRSRISEDRASSEGTRTELHAALEPSNRFAFRQRLHGCFNQLVIAHSGEPGSEPDQTGLYLRLAERWPEEG